MLINLVPRENSLFQTTRSLATAVYEADGFISKTAQSIKFITLEPLAIIADLAILVKNLAARMIKPRKVQKLSFKGQLAQIVRSARDFAKKNSTISEIVYISGVLIGVAYLYRSDTQISNPTPKEGVLNLSSILKTSGNLLTAIFTVSILYEIKKQQPLVGNSTQSHKFINQLPQRRLNLDELGAIFSPQELSEEELSEEELSEEEGESINPPTQRRRHSISLDSITLGTYKNKAFRGVYSGSGAPVTPDNQKIRQIYFNRHPN